MASKKKRVLLVEPAYANKYPPLGLMKIATAHKLKGDRVTFIRGTNAEIRERPWDRIYIASPVSSFDFGVATVARPWNVRTLASAATPSP